MLFKNSLLVSTAIGLAGLMGPGLAHAAPQGGVVSGGNATISQSGAKTDIHQHSHKVIIDWQSFDIGAGEHTQFHQPSWPNVHVGVLSRQNSL